MTGLLPWMPDESIEADFDRYYRADCPNCGSPLHRYCDPDAVYDERAERETEE